MGQFIYSAIGGVVGFLVGGPAGAQYGWMAGSLVGALVNRPEDQRGPMLDDLNIIGTEYGQCIPMIFGSPRIAGQIIWASRVRPIPNTQKVGKGGGQKVTTFTYEVDVLVMLSENVTEGVAREWLNSEMVYNGIKVKAGVWNGLSIYTGEDDQMPDPTYEAVVGVGRAPAFRGHTTMMIRGLQLGSGKNIPNLESELRKSTVVIDDRIRLLVNWPGGDEADQSLYETGGPTVSAGGTVSAGVLTLDFNTASDNGRYYTNAAFNTLGNQPVTYEALFRVTRHNSAGDINLVRFAPNGDNASDNKFPIQLACSGVSQGRELTVIVQDLDIASQPLDWGSGTDIRDFDTIHFAITFHDSNTASMWINGTRIRDHVVFNSATVLQGSARMAIGGPEGLTRDFIAEFYGVRIARAEVYSGASFTPPTALTGDLTSGSAEFGPGEQSLTEVVETLMQRAGYAPSQYDVTALDGIEQPVRGYPIGRISSTREAIEPLQPLFFFESATADKIVFFPRAVDPTGSIDWEDLRCSPEREESSAPFTLSLGNETELPAQIALRYSNVSANHNVGTEFSDRHVSSQLTTQQVEAPLDLLPIEAKKAVTAMLLDAIASLGRSTIKLPLKYAKIMPGEVWTLADPQGREYRLRILTKRDGMLPIEFDVALDDASALTNPVETSDDYLLITEPVRVAPTLWEAMDIPQLRDADNSAGYYVAVTPDMESVDDEWPGSVFVRAWTAEDFEQVFVSGDACVIGECLTTLGAFAGGSNRFDESNRLRVEVVGELAGTTRDDMLDDLSINMAVVGDELLRFRDAEFIDTIDGRNVYDLTGLVRGQRGTEQHIGGHAASERFVLLNVLIRRVTDQNSEIDLESEVKAVTLNTLLSDVTAESFTDTGVSLRPFSVANLRVLADGADLDFTWHRRTRMTYRYGGTVGVSVPLGETTEAYRVKIYDGSTLVRTAEVSTPSYTYTAANMASDGFTSSDPLQVVVCQLSEIVGEGFPAETTGVTP